MRKIFVLLALAILTASIGSFIARAPAHADGRLWFVGWIPNDAATGNVTYGYTVVWADLDASTVTITSDWGDGSTNSMMSIGTLNPDFSSPTFSASIQTYHIYTTAGMFSHTIRLSDSYGNAASITVSVTVTVHNLPPGVYGAGARAPVKM